MYCGTPGECSQEIQDSGPLHHSVVMRMRPGGSKDLKEGFGSNGLHICFSLQNRDVAQN
jgi:hypothetical protein